MFPSRWAGRSRMRPGTLSSGRSRGRRMRGFPRSRDSLVAVAAAWKKMPSNSSKLATALPLRDSFGFQAFFLCRL